MGHRGRSRFNGAVAEIPEDQLSAKIESGDWSGVHPVLIQRMDRTMERFSGSTVMASTFRRGIHAMLLGGYGKSVRISGNDD